MAEADDKVAADAAAKAAADASAAEAAAKAAEAAKAKAEADAAAAKEQTVPLSRFQSAIAAKAEEQRAKEALARELKLANDTIEEFRASLNKPKEGETPPAKPGPKALSPQELQQLVSAEARALEFNKRCNDAAAEGKKAHEDFDKVVLGDLTSVSPAVGQNGRPVLPQSLLEAALETGNAHEVLYALGKDVNEATRIMALSPTAQAVALAKFSDKISKAAEVEVEVDDEGKPIQPNVSKAPPPIKSAVKANGVTKPAWNHTDTEHFDTATWIRNREKEVRERSAAR